MNESRVMISKEIKDLLVNALNNMRGVDEPASEQNSLLEGNADVERQHIYLLIDALGVDMSAKAKVRINMANRDQSIELQRRLVELDEIEGGRKKRKSGEWRSSGYVPYGANSTPPGSYLLLHQAVEETDALSKRFSNVVEIRILWRLVAASDNPNMSHYQLSLACKKLADCYLLHDFKEKALRVYKMGLNMNPNLAVKRAIKSLEAELLDMTVVDIGK